MRPFVVKKFELTFNEEFLNPEVIWIEDATIDIKFVINNENTFEVTNINYDEKENLVKSLQSILDDEETKIHFDEFSSVFIESNKEIFKIFIKIDKGDGYITNIIKFENNAIIKKGIKNFIEKFNKIELLPASKFDFQTKMLKDEMSNFFTKFKTNVIENEEVLQKLINVQSKYSIDVNIPLNNITSDLYNDFTYLIVQITSADNKEKILKLVEEFDNKYNDTLDKKKQFDKEIEEKVRESLRNDIKEIGNEVYKEIKEEFLEIDADKDVKTN